MWMQEMKEKIVARYLQLIHNLHAGRQIDYSDIIDMIVFTETHEFFNNEGALNAYFLNK